MIRKRKTRGPNRHGRRRLGRAGHSRFTRVPRDNDAAARSERPKSGRGIGKPLIATPVGRTSTTGTPGRARKTQEESGRERGEIGREIENENPGGSRSARASTSKRASRSFPGRRSPSPSRVLRKFAADDEDAFGRRFAAARRCRRGRRRRGVAAAVVSGEYHTRPYRARHESRTRGRACVRA